jgi:hypothetical protein
MPKPLHTWRSQRRSLVAGVCLWSFAMVAGACDPPKPSAHLTSSAATASTSVASSTSSASASSIPSAAPPASASTDADSVPWFDEPPWPDPKGLHYIVTWAIYSRVPVSKDNPEYGGIVGEVIVRLGAVARRVPISGYGRSGMPMETYHCALHLDAGSLLPAVPFAGHPEDVSGFSLIGLVRYIRRAKPDVWEVRGDEETDGICEFDGHAGGCPPWNLQVFGRMHVLPGIGIEERRFETGQTDAATGECP